MNIQYEPAPDIKALVDDIKKTISFNHIILDRVVCVRSKGSKSKRIIARIHGLPRIWQESLGMHPYYIIEVISENYDCQDLEDREKTIIHELLHIPKGFKGGFRHHKGWINKKKIDNLHTLLTEKRKVRSL
jgi:predicted metallopeptidase